MRVRSFARLKDALSGLFPGEHILDSIADAHSHRFKLLTVGKGGHDRLLDKAIVHAVDDKAKSFVANQLSCSANIGYNGGRGACRRLKQ